MNPPIKEPFPLRWLRAQGLTRLEPWHLVDTEKDGEGLRREYCLEVSGGSQPERDIHPFARRQDQDDIAGFVVVDGVVTEAVLLVHLTWKGGPEVPGFPHTCRFENLWDWLKSAIDDAAEACEDERELEEDSAGTEDIGSGRT